MDKHLLLQAAAEIRELRRTNQILQAKVDTMDTLAAFLFSEPPRPSVGMAEDIAWKLDRAVEELNAKEGN
jgi:hypothetical protein